MEKKLFYNGKIVTMKDKVIYEALLIEDGRIKKVGNTEDLLKKIKEDDISIDLKGKTILPGFIDSHSHITAVGYDLMLVNVKPSPSGDCDSIDDIINKLKTALEEDPPEDGEWLMAMGYDESNLKEARIPNKNDLDKVSKDIPIIIIHTSGHAAVLNSKALEILGYVGEGYKVPKGGAIGTFEGTNEPNGFIAEAALLGKEAQDKIPKIDPKKIFGAIIKAQDLYASNGYTTAQDAKTGKSEYELLSNLSKMGLLKIDVLSYSSPEVSDDIIKDDSINNIDYNKHYRVAGYKFFLDGSPQAKTAWLSKPYYIPPEGKDTAYSGFRIHEDDEFIDICKKCIKNKWQINVHTNGDEAIEQFIRCYSKALKECSTDIGLRPVSVHCQTVREDQLNKMKKIGMIATFFLDHVYYWGDYHYESVLGPERAERISPLASAIRNGINYTMHQDSPVVKPNPIFAVYNAVNRLTKHGRVLGEEEKISVFDALKGITINAAYQIFEEDKKGTLEEGKLADLVILDKNPLEISELEIKNIKILVTIKEGKTIYNLES